LSKSENKCRIWNKNKEKFDMILGTLFIIAAASGTGKTSLAKALSLSLNDIAISISHTTRSLRNGEQNNSSYFFIDKKSFKKKIEASEFLEYAEVFGNYYGTERKWVLEQLTNGKDVILDIDWQGAKKVRKIMPESVVGIFLLPPSKQVLRQRLEMRNRDGKQVVLDRLDKAGFEISHYKDFDYLIVNDDFEKALADLRNIVCTHRLRCSRQAVKYAKLLKELISN